MKLRHWYTLAGIGWALLLGPGAAAVVAGVGAAIAWLWLFGDDPWPETVHQVLPALGIASGVVTTVACILIARTYGRQRESRPTSSARRERGTALILAAAPLAIILVLGLAAWKRDLADREAATLAMQRQTAFSELLAARHKVAGIRIQGDDEGTFHARIALVGERQGRYRMQWQVTGTSFGAALASGGRVLTLQEDRQEVPVTFTLDGLAHAYRAEVVPSGAVLVDEPFRLGVTLEPILVETERAALPQFELTRLQAGRSPLIGRASATFPVRFTIGRDGAIGK